MIANGGLHDSDVADDVIERGDADLIAAWSCSIGHAGLAEEDLAE